MISVRSSNCNISFAISGLLVQHNETRAWLFSQKFLTLELYWCTGGVDACLTFDHPKFSHALKVRVCVCERLGVKDTGKVITYVIFSNMQIRLVEISPDIPIQFNRPDCHQETILLRYEHAWGMHGFKH